MSNICLFWVKDQQITHSECEPSAKNFLISVMVLDSLPPELLLQLLTHPSSLLKSADLARLYCTARLFREPAQASAEILCRRHACCRDVPSHLLQDVLSLGLECQKTEEHEVLEHDGSYTDKRKKEERKYKFGKHEVTGRGWKEHRIGERVQKNSWIRTLFHLDALEHVMFPRTGSLAAGSCFSIGVSLTGEVSGLGSVRKFGIGSGSAASVDVPVRISSLPRDIRITQVAAGSEHSLFLSQEGEVFAAGDNVCGSLGLGLQDYWATVEIPQKIERFGDAKIVTISAGNYMSAAIDEFGKLYTFGGRPSMLGHGDSREEHEPREVVAFSGKKVFSVSIGFSHVLAIAETDKESGHHRGVYSWGFSDAGALGLGLTKFKRIPELIPDLCGTDIWPVGVSAGRNHSLALLIGGELLSWGNFEPQSRCQLGSGLWLDVGSGAVNHNFVNENDSQDGDIARSSGSKGDKENGTMETGEGAFGFEEQKLRSKYSDITKKSGPEWGTAVVPAGCLGHNKDIACCRPKLVEQFIGKNVLSIAAGWYVSYIVTDLGEVFEFGVTQSACQEVENTDDIVHVYDDCEAGEEIDDDHMSSVLMVASAEKFESVVSSYYDVASHTLLLGRSGRVFSFGYHAYGPGKHGGFQRNKVGTSRSRRCILEPQEIEKLNLGVL